MNGCEHEVWEMGGYHILWWWAFQNGEVEHYAVLHQEESGLEILNHDEEYLDERENETKFNEAPEAGHELLRLLAHSSGIELNIGDPSFRRSFPKRKSDGIANSPSSRNQNRHFKHFFRRPYNFLAPLKEISIMRARYANLPREWDLGARGG
jgi:hypothetical protein